MVSDQEIGVSADEIDPVGRRMLDVLLTIEEACIPYQEEMMAQGLDHLGERIFLPRTNDRGDWRKAGDSLFDADIHRQDIKELLTRYDDTPLMNSSKNRYMRQINACIIRIVYFGGLRQTEIVRLLKKVG